METTEVHFEVVSPLMILIVDSLSEIEEAIVIERKLSQQIRQMGLTTQALVHKWL